MYRKYFDLLIIAAVSLVAIVLTLAGVTFPPLMLLLGLPLVFFTPGYALVQTLTDSGMGKSERLLFSGGLSLLVAIVGGLLMNLTPWGLRPQSWVLWLGGVTLLATGTAVIRRLYSASRPNAFTGFRLKLSQAGLLGLAVVILVAAIMVSRSGAFAAERQDTFTQLWALPADQGIKVGLVNEEAATVKYRVEIVVGGVVIKEWSTLEVAPGNQWEATAELPGEQTPGERVVVNLYRLDNPATVYRQVFLPLG